ncbi:MAG: transcription-repair coupling factor [Piscirickettsiaceae bacterium]|nr:transcription-repair coupling factor [Piscirickettsiaceae bacterium]
MIISSMISPLYPQLPQTNNDVVCAGQLHGSAQGLLLSKAALQHDGPLVVITDKSVSALRLKLESQFYASNAGLDILYFPDWGTLPYDNHSPHQDVIFERLSTLYKLPNLKRGLLFISISTMMHRITPCGFLKDNTLKLEIGDFFRVEDWTIKLKEIGYHYVSQVMKHGEFTIHGTIVDIYPMGSQSPYRINCVDDKIVILRILDHETQRSSDTVNLIYLLPTREFLFTDGNIKLFLRRFCCDFLDVSHNSPIYKEVISGDMPEGIEYYLPLFHRKTSNILDYLPENALLVNIGAIYHSANAFWEEIGRCFQKYRSDLKRLPLFNPIEMFFPVEDLFTSFKGYQCLYLQTLELDKGLGMCNYGTTLPPNLTLNTDKDESYEALSSFIDRFEGRILLVIDSEQYDALLSLLNKNNIHFRTYKNWDEFFYDYSMLGIIAVPLEYGLILPQNNIAVIAGIQLLGHQDIRSRCHNLRKPVFNTAITNLTDLHIGDAVVHEDHGVGRYLGLQTLSVGDVDTEYVALKYFNDDKLYVPVSALNLIVCYSGAASEFAPLHKLGSSQWKKARSKASEKLRDVAAELLDIYAERAIHKKTPIKNPDEGYSAFISTFPFDTTLDQQNAIDDVFKDMTSNIPMDRLLCGDVGFGKTEVAMRASFLAVQSGKQVIVLVPTTLLAQQHYKNFKERFAGWPINIEIMSRFCSNKQLNAVKLALSEGTSDIIISTHKIIQQDVQPRRLGLFILDEEHRFGVSQKERIKKYRSRIDVLTLTATPIPRTLNMSILGIRDVSIISTPPARRLEIKTFVQQWDERDIREGMLREIRRGGQVYFLHNKVKDIDRFARKIKLLLPEAKVGIAHGKMRERDLEQVMVDFYNQRFNILICTTIIETGIDVPSANTIFIDRADKLSLSQLHQIRGRVGRSHHRAYAYLIVPSQEIMTQDAIKRLEAIKSIEYLGAGLALSMHDLEIRGAGELLGDDQSGQIREIGFALYNKLLKQTIDVLKLGKDATSIANYRQYVEIDLHAPALIPTDYLPDVHTRLVLYKRISSALDRESLCELQVEMIDRFGPLPEHLQTLFAIYALRLRAGDIGILKIDVFDQGGCIIFDKNTNIDPINIIELVQKQPDKFKLYNCDKLCFFDSMSDINSRIAVLEQLLKDLQN